jgi:hypothetical protein
MNKIISKFFSFFYSHPTNDIHRIITRPHAPTPQVHVLPLCMGVILFFIYFLCLHACQYISFIVHSRHPKCHTRFQGSKTWARTSPNVLGSSLTHMMTHDIETNITSLIYNEVLYKIVK